MNQEPKESKLARPPIIVVMGHIDHGKTSILDFYRKTKVVEKETGGITQHIGAYEVVLPKGRVTFLDTPGHEAFSKIRGRGAHAADLAILVVAADEGVKPQTKEAIDIIRRAELPFVVALNKNDRPEANPERVKQELAKEGVLVESYGGKIPAVLVSAKTGQGMDELLEMVLLVAQLAELKAHPEHHAEGVVIETHRNSRRGLTATLLILDGTLTKKDVLVIGRAIETPRILENFQEKPITEAGPSSPVLVAGLATLPSVGDTFKAFPTKGDAHAFIAALPIQASSQQEIPTKTPSEKKRLTFNIILKADVAGSREALEESLTKLGSDIIAVKILSSGIGDINESDTKHAQATRLVTIVGFRVKADAAARELAEHANIHMVTGDIIYDIIENVKKAAEELLPPEIKRMELGRIKILKIFKKDGVRHIIGGHVETGKVRKGAYIDFMRMKETLGTGIILQLQREKTPVEEVSAGAECGLMVESKIAVAEGDTGEIYEEEVIKRTL